MMLANVGSDVLSQLERFKESFLWAAAKGGRVEECESLVQMGTDVNWISPEGDTPLLAACRNGHAPVALCLLSHGASVNQAANDGQTALHLSVRHGNEAVAEALILGGADVFARDNGGATALESEGPHIPDGMLQRLNVIAQRTGRRNHHDGFGNESRGDGTPDASTSTNRRSGNPLFDAETLRTPTSGRRPEIDGIGRPGWRRSSTEQHREYRRADDLHGGETAAFSTADGERNNAHRGGGGRITFPSISRKVGSVNSTGSRQSSSFHVASRAGPSGGGEGFQHGEDQDESLYEDDTRVRLLGGFYHRSGPRQQASLSVRNGARGSDGIREDTQLLSAGDPVPHASAAIAAALASASVAASGASAATTATTSRSSAFSPTTSDTLVAAPSRSPPHLFDSTGNPAASWEAGADEGGGHGIVADAGGNSTSGSIIGRSSGRSTGSAHGGGRGNDGGGGGGGDDDEESRSGTPRNTQTATPTSTAAGRANGNAIAAARSGGRAQQELEARGGFESGDAPYANIPIPILGPRNSGSGRGGVAGGMRYGGGYDGGLTEEAQASNEHVGLIRALWLQEKESRLASEAKAEAVRDQSARLWNELVRSEKQVLSLEEGAASLREERDKLKATLSGDGFKGRCLPELEQLEKDLRKALEGVCAERERIVQERLAKEEQRLCVVCQENERGVLLLPCRHLCVCKGCSERRELTLCPLCRNHIAETLVVYS